MAAKQPRKTPNTKADATARSSTRTNDLQERLRESEIRDNRLLDNLKNEYLFYRHENRGKFTFTSTSYYNILGFRPKEYLGLFTPSRWTDNPINKEATRKTKPAIQGRRQVPHPMEIYYKNGERWTFVTTEMSIFNGQGRVNAVEGTARNITEKRRIEQEPRIHEI